MSTHFAITAAVAGAVVIIAFVYGVVRDLRHYKRVHRIERMLHRLDPDNRPFDWERD